jgi:GT2 family glycosyltransferase
LCVVVCHNGEPWLHQTLSALRRSSLRPRHVLAVDTGSTDRTAGILAEAESGGDRIVDGVLTLDADTGYAEAVNAATEHAARRWGDPGEWVWLLHDDCAPEPDCLATLLAVADTAKSVGALGPLHLDWADPRLIVEAGLSLDAAGHRRTGVVAGELDWGRVSGTDSERGAALERNTEVLAVSSAGALIRSKLLNRLDGLDPAYPVMAEDIDFGWRVNKSGHLVLCVPSARMRHARALSTGQRKPHACPSTAAAERLGGVRAFLVNVGLWGFLLGVPRLTLLCLARAFGTAVTGRFEDANAELRAAGALATGKLGLRAARMKRRGDNDGGVRGLMTTRSQRLRGLVRGGISTLVRRRVAADVALGWVPAPDSASAWVSPEAVHAAEQPVGPAAVPAGAVGRGAATRGLRLPSHAVVMQADDLSDPAPTPVVPRGPSPGKRGAQAKPQELMLVELTPKQLVKQFLFAPALLLLVALVAVALVTNRQRLGLDLVGGRILPPAGLGDTWREYFASWHAVAGGTGAQAPAAVAVLGVLGAPFWLIGGTAAAVSLLLIADAPIAGMLAYYATRHLRAPRWVRALLAGAYALAPPAIAAVAQGRIDAVVVHLLLPLVLLGMSHVLLPAARIAGRASWLSDTVLCALGIAAIGAFSPLVQGLLVLLALIGFVVLPSAAGEARRRVASLFVVVLLPLALLLPWPAVLLQHPSVLLHGVGATVPAEHVSIGQLLTLDPGGAGTWPFLGVLVLLSTLFAVVVRPRVAVVPGLVTAAIGAGGVALVAAMPVTPLTGGAPRAGWTGAPMLVLIAGALLAVTMSCAWEPGGRRSVKLSRTTTLALAGAGSVVVLLFAFASVTAGARGPLHAGADTLADAQATSVAADRSAVLVLGNGQQSTRQRGERMPSFGDDDIPPSPDSIAKLASWTAQLNSGDPKAVQGVLASAAASGVTYVVAPDQAAADRIRQGGRHLVDQVQPTKDGHPVLRVRAAAASAVLIAPTLAKQAVTGGTPPATPDPKAVTAVDSHPPEVAVRVSEGSRGRLLVVAAEYEAGWRATIDGKDAPITEAWGHLVSVSVPEQGGDVRLFQSSTLRDLLLLGQAAAVLFTLLTAVPLRRR